MLRRKHLRLVGAVMLSAAGGVSAVVAGTPAVTATGLPSPAQDPSVSASYSCVVPSGPTIFTFTATVSGSAPASVSPGSQVSVSNYQVSISVPANLVSDLVAFGATSPLTGTVTVEDVDASGASPATINAASTPIPFSVPLISGQPATIQSQSASVGPFTAGAPGTIDFTPGTFTLTGQFPPIGQASIPCTLTTSPPPTFASTTVTQPVAGSTITTSFTTPGEHPFTVPNGVTNLYVVAVGGAGTLGEGGLGSAGATVTAFIPVTPGTTQYAEVGIGGGPGGTFPQIPPGGAGGGESDLRTCSPAASNCGSLGSAQDPRILVAGGGGGGGALVPVPGVGPLGGSGGVGGAGANSSCNPGTPGGNGQSGGASPGGGGSNGTCSGGGMGGIGGSGNFVTGFSGGDGGAGFGGAGGLPDGGGGGAGYFGGGGGGGLGGSCSPPVPPFGPPVCPSGVGGPGGGGGGSSFAEGVASHVSMFVNAPALPSVTISYTLPANQSGANLSAANLQGANLAGFNFNGATLTGANLSGTNLTGTNLNRAKLSGSDLIGANLTEANLNGANLTGANLSTAVLTGANLNGVTWSDTTCPDGTNSDADGGSCNGHL